MKLAGRRSAAIALLLALLLAPAARGGEGTAGAKAVVEASGVTGGLSAHVGAGDPDLAVALGAEGRFVVQVLTAQAASLAEVRKRIRERKLYGRVTADAWSPDGLPYADGLVNLLIVENAGALVARGLKLEECARVLAPGGAACFSGLGDSGPAVPGLGKPVRSGRWTVLRKPRPAEMDEWTHYRHGPDRRATSRDLLVGPSDAMRWIDGPQRSRNHSSRPAAAVSAAGRLFYVYDYGEPFHATPPRALLVARDAFSGVVLWEKALSLAAEYDVLLYPGAAVVARGEYLYAPTGPGKPLVRFNAADGSVSRVYEGSRPDSLIHLGAEMLLLERNRLRLVEEAGGREKWRAEVGKYKNRMLVDGNRVFVHVTRGSAILCFDLKGGSQLWRKEDDAFGKHTYVAGCVSGTLVHSGAGLLRGISAADGRDRWSFRYNMSNRGSPANVFFSGGLVWCHEMGGEGAAESWVGLDPGTGKPAKTVPVTFTDKCAPGKATEKYLISGRMSFTDWQTGKTRHTKAARASCGFGAIHANGMTYTFPTDCRCFPQLKGIMGLGHAGEAPGDAASPSSNSLVRGRAFGSVPGTGAAPGGAEDWPVYRHDPERSGASPARVPAGLSPIWSVEVGGRVSPPTVAAGRVFVSAIDAHRVLALDAGSGKQAWSFETGGRVDSPPTYSRGAVVFGSRDGWIYCLRASDGELAWKLRAAPAEKTVFAYRQLESVWPVQGSLPVVDGRLYATVGRHTYLDGGLSVVCVDLGTGRLLWRTQPARSNYADLLVRNGSWICMRLTRFDLESGKEPHKRRELPGYFYSGNSSPFFDSTYAFRTQWVFEERHTAQMLSFDARRVLGFHGFREEGKYSTARPGKGDYELWLGARDGKSVLWSGKLPIRPRALVLTADAAVAAGPVDDWPYDEGLLVCHSLEDGKELSRLPLKSPPVFDGAAVAGGRIYLATEDGRLHCLGAR